LTEKAGCLSLVISSDVLFSNYFSDSNVDKYTSNHILGKLLFRAVTGPNVFPGWMV